MTDGTREKLAHAFLLSFLAACLFVAASVLGLPVWLAPVPAALALLLQLRRVPRALAVLARGAVIVALAAVVIVGAVHALYPVVPPEQMRAALRGLALALCALTTLVGFGARVLSPTRVLLPAGIGLALAAALCVSGERQPLDLPPLLPWPLLALVAYLLASSHTRTVAGTRGIRRRRSLRLALSLVVALVAGLGVTRLLPWATPLVERLFGDAGASAGSGFGSESRLGDIERLALDHSVALRLWTDAPRYLRLRVATRFASSAWRAEPALLARRPAPVLSAPEPAAFSACAAEVPGRTLVVARQPSAPERLTCAHVLPAQYLRTDALPTTAGTVLLRTPSRHVELDSAGIVSTASGRDLDLLGFGAWPEPLEPAIRETPEMLSACLALPAALDPRLRALADRLAASAPTAAGRIEATVRHVQSTCHYSLEVGRFHTRDPVAEFLFEKRRGYCEYFASAAVLLLRLEGVPARYVTGFSTRAADRAAGHYVVRMSDAHAWVEAFVDGHWREVDPTPAAEYDMVHGRTPRWLSVAWEALHASWLWISHAVRQSVRAADLRALVHMGLRALRFPFVDHPVATLVALLLAGAVRLRVLRRLSRWRGLRRSRPLHLDGSQAALASAFARLERLLARRGAARPAARPPLTHVRGLPSDKIEPALRALAEDVVRVLYAALFEGACPDAAVIADLGRRLTAAESARRRPRRAE